MTELVRFSLFDSSRIRVLVCPVGKIKKSAFKDSVDRLRKAADVRLGDVTPHSQHDRALFNPQKFPAGRVSYNLLLYDDRYHEYLEGFQIHRRCLVVLGVADYSSDESLDDMTTTMKSLRERYPGALLHKGVVFNYPSDDLNSKFPHLLVVPPRRVSNTTSVYTSMCDLTSEVLIEFPSLLNSIRSSDSILSPLGSKVTEDLELGSASDSDSSGKAGPRFQPKETDKSNTHRRNMSNLSMRDTTKRRTKARMTKLSADMYLLAGHTTDALHQYVEAYIELRALDDYVWQASSLEGIGISLLLLSLLQVPFNIPAPILQMTEEHDRNKDELKKKTKKADGNQLSVDSLRVIMDNCLVLYEKSLGIRGESAPPVIVTETILKFATFLTDLSLNGGWDKYVSEAKIPSFPAPESLKSSTPLPGNKVEITHLLARIRLDALDRINVFDRCSILTVMASIYKRLGMERKQAFMLRETIKTVMPKIIQARVMNAAESGIHPTTSFGLSQYISMTNGDIVDLLSYICKPYAVADYDLQDIGWQSVKVGALQTCIRYCEANQMFASLVGYISILLNNCHQYLDRRDELHLVMNLSRAVSSSAVQGVPATAKFWMKDLVKSIKILETERETAIALSNDEQVQLSNGENGDVFIHNAFSKLSSGAIQHLLIEGEASEFLVLLENPCSYDVEIESLQIETEGNVALLGDLKNIILPANGQQSVTIMAVAHGIGDAEIIGCKALISSCAAETFFLPGVMSPQRQPVNRLKSIGLACLRTSRLQDVQVKDLEVAPRLTCINAQPLLMSTVDSPYKDWIMLLEGEIKQFTISLKNVSEVSASILDISFTDSTVEPLETALKDKDRLPHELFEIEHFLYDRPSLSIKTSLSRLNPKEEQTLQVEIRGKRGFKRGTISVRYTAELHDESKTMVPISNMLPISVLEIPIRSTVNSGIELSSCQLIPLDSTNARGFSAQIVTIIEEIGDNLFEDYCILAMDFLNSWVTPIKLSFLSRLTDTPAEGQAHNGNHSYQCEETIEAGKTLRVFIPIRRVLMSPEEASMPIPLRTQRQFVVSDRPNESDLMKKSFWYREKLLKNIEAAWVNSLENRQGLIELRSLQMTPSMMDILERKVVLVKPSLKGEDCCFASDLNIWHSPNDSFSQLKVEIVNQGIRDIRGVLRMQPFIQDLPFLRQALDLEKRLVLSGALQQPIYRIAPGERYVVELDVIVLARGVYEWDMYFEELNQNGSKVIHTPKNRFVMHSWEENDSHCTGKA